MSRGMTVPLSPTKGTFPHCLWTSNVGIFLLETQGQYVHPEAPTGSTLPLPLLQPPTSPHSPGVPVVSPIYPTAPVMFVHPSAL